MATRAMSNNNAADLRAAWRRSMRRAGQIAGAAGSLALLVFLTLALASYAQTDPSGSTAASSQDIANWMGAPGAWVAERVLLVFGFSGLLMLPLLYVTARRLWRGYEDDESDEPIRWWRPLGMLLVSMGLLRSEEHTSEL